MRPHAPAGGAVYYDGRDLRHLNVKQVRRNIGAVPQDVQLHPQDLWDNIVAHHEAVNADEAWQAARIAGIDSEIRAMPKSMANLASLTSTRIVIAHRLSTLRQADRIYVMRAGKVAESGSFADPVQGDGVFRDLVRRQIA